MDNCRDRIAEIELQRSNCRDRIAEIEMRALVVAQLAVVHSQPCEP